VLSELGGKWSSGKQAHVFGACPKAAIAAALASGELLTERDFEFFPTPPELVAQLLLLTGLRPGMKVLEPSAGHGAIALSAAEVVGKNNVTCHELMPRNVKHLQGLGFSVDECKDFLQVVPTPVFDRVLLNPPFSQGKDMAHIEHALKFLKPGGRLGAIASTSWQTAKNAKSSAFRAWVKNHAVTVEQIDRGAFKASGTEVPTVMLVLQASGQPTDQVATPPAVSQDNAIMDELAAAFA
jgi:predicted RNA methylase